MQPKCFNVPFVLFLTGLLVAEVKEDILAVGCSPLTHPLGVLILPAAQLLSALHASQLLVRWEEFSRL